jgi:AICAR transformylase/IMP cyclohydrolase PurH/REP element-mobilizing transposase RayT
MPDRKIRRALIAVYDKTGIAEFARALVDEFGIEIISTGGTAKHLKEAGIPVTLVEEVTGFPEMLDGRVKTLHPKVHAAILADRDNPEHMRQLAEQGIEPIDMVVVNLYPFEKTVADPNCTFEQAIEMIDIGGPCLLRAAAKNHKHVLVVCASFMYERCLEWLRLDSTQSEEGERLLKACGAFRLTQLYDAAVWCYLVGQYEAVEAPPEAWQRLPAVATVLSPRSFVFRYGENPHQLGGLYSQGFDVPALRLSDAESQQPTSYNNAVDFDAALGLCSELTRAGLGSAKLCFAAEPAEPGSANLRFAQGASSGNANLRFVREENAGRVDLRSSSDPKVVRSPSIREEVFTRRKLPHWKLPGACYWVTFTSAIGELTEEERDITLSAIRHWDGKKLDLYAAVVMRDHVHLLLAPRELPDRRGEYYDLSSLMKSIKSFSGREISQRRGGLGQVWVRESFDRWIRSDEDFLEKWKYIADNPVKEGLAATASEYRWWYGVDVFGVGVGVQRDVAAASGDEAALRPTAGNKAEPCPTRENKAEPCSTRGAVCVFIKHTNACGAAVEVDPIEAYRKAYLGDPNAAMGGILAVNFEVTTAFAETVMETYQRWGKAAGAGGFFVEVWIAPSFEDQAVEVIRARKEWGKRVRLLGVGDMSKAPAADAMVYRSIAGGMLVQTPDVVGLNEGQWKVVTKRGPTDAEMADLRLTWLICKHTKSNAITVCKGGMLIGNGAGQMSRVMSCRIATWLAKENGHADMLQGAVAASDAFFPFRDGPDILMDAGITAFIQPGGSKRDEDTIAACDERGAAMIFTGTRHFKH